MPCESGPVFVPERQLCSWYLSEPLEGASCALTYYCCDVIIVD